MTTATKDQQKTIAKLYKLAVEKAHDRIGGFRAFNLQSTTVRRALVAGSILYVATDQDEVIRAETVRLLINGLADLLNDDQNVNE